MKNKMRLLIFIIFFFSFCFFEETSNAEIIKLRPWEYYKFNIIAYSQLYGEEAPINSAEHFEYCAQMDCFTSIKADVRITKDDGLILCHDKGFTLNKEGKITGYNQHKQVLITNLTTEQCLSLEYENYYNDNSYKVTDFETYIRICKKYNKIPFITVRDEKINIIVSKMIPILEKYDLVEKCIINSFTKETLEQFRKANKNIMLSNVLDPKATLTKEDIDWAIKMGNCLINLYDFPPVELSKTEKNNEFIQYARMNDVMIYEAISDEDNVEELYNLGIQGGQYCVIPTKITEQDSAIPVDFNDDGKITALDLVTLKKVLNGKERPPVKYLVPLDVNRDGLITAQDLLLTKKILNKEEKLWQINSYLLKVL